MTLPPGAQPAARPTFPPNGEYGSPPHHSPEPFGRAGPARYNLSAAFGPNKNAPTRTPSVRYNPAAAFGPTSDSGHSSESKGPARYNASAAFGPPKSDSSHSSESRVRYNPAAAFGPRSDARSTPTPSPAARQPPRSDAVSPPARLPPGARAPVEVSPHSDAEMPRAGRAHQFGEGHMPIPVPQGSVYATPMSTPPATSNIAERQSAQPARPQHSPSRTQVKDASLGLPSPPESPLKLPGPPQPPNALKPSGTFVVKHTATSKASPLAVPGRLPPSTSSVPQASKAPAEPPSTPPNRTTAASPGSPGSFTVRHHIQNPPPPQTTSPSSPPHRLPQVPPPAVKPQVSATSFSSRSGAISASTSASSLHSKVANAQSLSPQTTPPKTTNPLPANSAAPSTPQKGFVIRRPSRSHPQTGSPTPAYPQRLPQPLINQASISSLRASSVKHITKSGSGTSLRVPEPVPTPMSSRQPSTDSLLIPRTDSPKPIKQASNTSLRVRGTDTASKQAPNASHSQSQHSPSRQRGKASSSSLRAPVSSSRSTHSARSASPRPSSKHSTPPSPPHEYRLSTDPSELDCPPTAPETPTRTPTPRLVLPVGARVWGLEHVRNRVVDIVVKDHKYEHQPVLSHLMRVNRASFCSVIAVLYANISFSNLPLNLPVPTHRMSVYRAAVHNLDLSGCLVASRGRGFFELFDSFPNLETVACGKVEMARPSSFLDIRVTRRLPMRPDGIFYTIHPFEPCLPRNQDAEVSYALEFGSMPRAGAQRFAEGQKHATVPPVLCRPIHSLVTDQTHSARAWLSILARRAQDYPHPQRLLLSPTEPVSLGEFAAFAPSASGIEELRLAVDLTDPAISPADFFATVDWTVFASLKKLHLILFVPPPPKAEEHFSTRVRLQSSATIATISTVTEEPTAPIETKIEPLSVRERVSRPVSGLFKGIGAFAKGFKKEPRTRVDSEPVRHRVHSEAHRSQLSPRPMSEMRRPPSILDPDFGAFPPEPSLTFPAPPEIPPPELALAELHLNLSITLPEWAAYDAGGDDWGYIRASVPHPAQLKSSLLRFGPGCTVHVKTQTTTLVDGVDDISADYEMRVVGRIADAFGRYGPFGSDAQRSMYIDN
ncbi:hypothetical protein CcaverHIS002_0704500 [Cutaneotrichosporon cavernicola]|nr:hypothetical protein CcaverHIS002_0704500 [Cutaneotrichosporon cavernicola]